MLCDKQTQRKVSNFFETTESNLTQAFQPLHTLNFSCIEITIVTPTLAFEGTNNGDVGEN